MTQLRRQELLVEQNNINIVIVTFENAESALNYQHETTVEWPIVVDTSRKLYSYYGMARASFWDLWGFATWKVYIAEMLKGNMPKRAQNDISQRGGDVLIDPEGMVVLHHIGKGPADRPSLDEVVSIIERQNRNTQVGISSEDLQTLKN